MDRFDVKPSEVPVVSQSMSCEVPVRSRTGWLRLSTDDNLFRASTYDLSVGEIILAGHWSGGKEHTVPSGGTVRVVSKESLRMSTELAADRIRRVRGGRLEQAGVSAQTRRR